jgi:5-methylcytosine-specific restriction enzyme subunit McrC
MFVDIVHLFGSRPVIVADAKYKAEGAAGRYPNADKYQMLAYCTVLGVQRAWLIYAQGRSVATARRIRGSDVEIVEWPLDLSTSSADLLAQVDALADAMMRAAQDDSLALMPAAPARGGAGTRPA